LEAVLKEIKLTRGKVAKVSDEDYDWLSQYKWSASPTDGGARFDAKTTLYKKWDDGYKWRRSQLMSRMIMDAKRGEVVDHINNDPLDNRRSNLRISTHQQNTWNRRKSRTYHGSPPTSKFMGVTKSTTKKKGKEYNYWRAQINHDGKIRYIGQFETEKEAAEAYDKEAQKLRGEYANLNG
jgi:hypothetical protein